ncbi:MAG: arylesterase [Opitutales bacterium]
MAPTTPMPPKSAKQFVQRVGRRVGWLIGLAGLLTAPVAAATEAPRTLVFLGDSLTAGAGVDPAEAYPAVVERKLQEAGRPWRVVNAGLSGETTAGGLRRLDWVLRQPVDLIVIELGGNDGLRGIAPELTRANLQAMIDRVRTVRPQAVIVLAGMQVPPNLGPDYTRAFARIFPELAARNHTGLIPFLLEGVGGVPELNQPDGIHPTAEGHRRVAETVWRVLLPLL